MLTPSNISPSLRKNTSVLLIFLPLLFLIFQVSFQHNDRYDEGIGTVHSGFAQNHQSQHFPVIGEDFFSAENYIFSRGNDGSLLQFLRTLEVFSVPDHTPVALSFEHFALLLPEICFYTLYCQWKDHFPAK